MPDVFVALLRAVNVGGTGRLTMAELAAACAACGVAPVRTVGTSGNAVFRDGRDERALRSALATSLATPGGRSVGILVRPVGELRDILARDPFPGADPALVHVLFSDEPMGADPLAGARGLGREEIRAVSRALVIHYPDGAGRSRLRLPAQANGTARNLAALRRIVEAADLLPSCV